MESIAQIDAALMRLPGTPTSDEDLEERARLMTRRLELENVARVAAATPRQQSGGLEVVVPGNAGCIYTRAGRTVYVEQVDGRMVVRLHQHEFRDLIASKDCGAAWAAANPDLVRAMAGVRQPL